MNIRFGRSRILRNPDGDAGGASGAVVPPVQPAAVPAPAAQAAQPPAGPSAEAIRAELLAKLGVKDEAELETAIKAAKDAENARLTSAQKVEKELRETLAAREKSEAKVKELQTKLDAQVREAAMRDLFDEQDVTPGKSRVMLRALYEASKESVGDKFKEEEFWTQTKQDYPSLFRTSVGQGQGASQSNVTAISTRAVVPLAVPPQASASGQSMEPKPFNALTATPQERRARRNGAF